MQITMKKHEFELLMGDLGQGCFIPLIKIYKSRVANQPADVELQIKKEFYKELTDGQQALFMFYTYYNHVSKSITEFYWWSAYFMAQPETWSAIKSSLKYFEDVPFLSLLESVEFELKHFNHPDSLKHFSVTRNQLDKNKDLNLTIKALHNQFEKISPLTTSKLNEYIKKNPEKFVEIEK